MAKNLVVIESPNKEKTIKKYLGSDYEIIATVGHIRDIPTSGSKCYNPKTYEPNWKISVDSRTHKSKKDVINKIKAAAKKADKVYLASDPDREGEAIAWHVYEVLDKAEQEKCTRITFNEITKDAIEEAIKHERKIELDWVHSQFARRILDRIVGYDLSKFVKNKFQGSSAGRVQSVALKFIYEREQEILKFKPVTTYTLDVVLANGDPLILREVPKKITDIAPEEEGQTGIDFTTEEAAKQVKDGLEKYFEVYYPKGVKEETIRRRNPSDPFKTSTLQQAASNKLGWSISKITAVIQDLYEGIEIKGEHQALITYPRTDSIRMSDSFKNVARSFIKKVYGETYVGLGNDSKALAKQAQKENVQDAHECIRCIDPFVTPASIKKYVTEDYYKMYELIWRRSIASLMTPCRYLHKVIRFKNDGCKFYTYANVMQFDGYKKVYFDEPLVGEGTSNDYEAGDKFIAQSIEINQHISEPPARYNQASLVKALDDAGVGRPSTYRMMVDINPERGYCEINQRAFYMTKLGNAVIEGLIDNFDDVIDKDFTKTMEERLDAIADSKEPWNKWLIQFVPSFEKRVSKKNKTVKATTLEVEGRVCPKCGKPLVYRFSPKTRKQFIGCSAYPDCDYAEFPGRKDLDIKCPVCGHHLREMTNRRGQKFIGCSHYPKCRFIAPNIEVVTNGTKEELDALIAEAKKPVVKKTKKSAAKKAKKEEKA